MSSSTIDVKIAPMKPLTGWRSDYYDLPEGAEGLQDLIEFKNMNFARANIFKAAYRLGEKQGTTELYDIDKILWYAQREKARLLKLEEEQLDEKIPGNAHDSASPDD